MASLGFAVSAVIGPIRFWVPYTAIVDADANANANAIADANAIANAYADAIAIEM